MNVVGAMVVALGDRLRDATEAAAGMTGPLPAALVSLDEWAGGRTVDTLAGALRLSHSRTVRVVDRLAAAGLARRERDPADGRGVLVRLTPAGERVDRAAARPLAQRDERRRQRAAHAGRVLRGVAHAVAQRDHERTDDVEIMIHVC